MKIALVIFRADPQRGGAERYTADIAGALGKRGHQIALFATRFGPPIPGVRFVTVPTRGATRASRYLSFLDNLDTLLADEPFALVHAMLPVRRCDIYHPHAGMAKAAVAAWTSRLNRKRRTFAQVEESLIHGIYKPTVLCLSDYIKSSILQHYPEIESQLVKLFNAVDLKRFDPETHAAAATSLRQRLQIPSGDVVALMMAQHFVQKGLPQAIDAVASLSRGPRLLIVGKDNPDTCARQAKRLGIADRVHFAGTTDSPADFYAASDFFVLPTRHDSCSLVALEALAMGLPVISTVFNGACEIMAEGKHGFVLPDPGNVPALADAINRLTDRPTPQTMSQACLSLRPALSFETHVDRLEEIYANRRRS